MQVAEGATTVMHRAPRRGSWRNSGPEKGGGGLRGSSVQTFGVHLKDWITS